MLDPVKQAIIYDTNARYFGYLMEKLMERAGQGIAKILLKKYGPGKHIGFFCGPGNNGGDGLAAARYLLKTSKPEVFLVPQASQIFTKEAKKNWQRFNGSKHEGVRADDIPDKFDIVVECLFGTGGGRPLKEPYISIVKKINSLKGIKVAVDLPVKGFKTEQVISLMFKKTPGADVVDIGLPAEIKEKIGPGEVKMLYQPPPLSHKGQNGKLLIVAGNEKYHGSLLLAAKMASKIVDLVYVFSTDENITIIKKIKPKLAEFITIFKNELAEAARNCDAILIGPGLGAGQKTKEITEYLLKKFSNKKFILDADALKVIEPKMLNKNCLVTPHAGEFKALFGISVSKKTVGQMAKKYNCIIVLKGPTDYVASPQELKINVIHNPGMTKGGTGDVLAGLIGALACKNDLFLAGCAGIFLNGLAGNRLKEKVSYWFNASDLISEIPKAMKWCEDF